jgi:hypothetical protein
MTGIGEIALKELLSQGVLGIIVVLEAIAIAWLVPKLIASYRERSEDKVKLLEQMLESQNKMLIAISAIQKTLEDSMAKISDRIELDGKVQQLLLEVKAGKRE